MPYKSAKQRAYLHANEPAVAAKWDKKYGTKVKKSKKKAAKRKAKAKRSVSTKELY